MAIFDFTKFLNAVFTLKPTSFDLPSNATRKHENISLCNSSFEQNYTEVAQAFWMLTKTYNFSLIDGDDCSYLGLCRVTSIVINDRNSPELLLEDQHGKEIGFYSIRNLVRPDLSAMSMAAN